MELGGDAPVFDRYLEHLLGRRLSGFNSWRCHFFLNFAFSAVRTSKAHCVTLIFFWLKENCKKVTVAKTKGEFELGSFGFG